jgi:protein O-mannosyl-transferase
VNPTKEEPLASENRRPARPGPAEPDRRGMAAGMCVLLGLAVLLVFGRTLQCDFINYDDDQYFYGNPHVQQGLTGGGVVWAFQTMYAANWHPMTWLSLMLDREIFGSGPLGPHLTNVLLHAANTVLLFLLLKNLTGALWRSALAAALFGLHPLHVESVAWVSERKDVLSGLFFMLTLLAWGQYVKTSTVHGPRSKKFYGLSLLCFALGLMSKPMLVTMPLVLLLLDFWPLKRPVVMQLVAEKLPFLALSGIVSVVTLIAQKGAVQPLTHISFGIRSVNAVVTCVRYLYKMFWPANLAIPYPHYGYWPFWLFGAAAALMLTAVTFAVQYRNRYPFLITGWFWYLGMLIPVIGLVQVGMQSMADRYTYLPLIGVFIVLVWGADAVFQRGHLPAAIRAVLAGLVLAACAGRSGQQLAFWKNSETLFHHAAAVTRSNNTAYYNLGEYYVGQGRLDEAIENYRTAVQISPHYDDALNNLGVALAMKGDLDEAVGRIREAIHCRPDKADAYYNLGNVFVMQHKMDDAADAYTEALRLKPDYPEAHNNLANVLLARGQREAAVQHYREALRLDPGHEGAKRQLRALDAQSP